MVKKLITIAIMLLILAMVVSPAAAVLPAKSPLPPNNPWNVVWTLFKDLQNQITALDTKVTAAPKIVVGHLGYSSGMTTVPVPAGYTQIDCTIMLRPPPVEMAYHTGSESNPPSCSYHLTNFDNQAYTLFAEPGVWYINHRMFYSIDAGNPADCDAEKEVWNNVDYLIVCTKS